MLGFVRWAAATAAWLFVLVAIRTPATAARRAARALFAPRPPAPLRPPAPPLTAQVTQLSAGALAAAIADPTSPISAAAAVEAYIWKLGETKRAGVGAVVAERYAEARAEAAAVDAQVRGGSVVGVLGGVPVTVKECFAVAGMPQTAGVPGRQAVVADADAPAVAGLRAAGCIVLAVTNTSEACMWFESHNDVWGWTTNAHSSAHTAGGSSGGEGAAVGAGASLLGLTSDVGGSTRMPAFFNGVFGLKPSPGRVPNMGQFPSNPGEIQHILATGPVSRYAADLLPALAALSSPAAARAAAAGPDAAVWAQWSRPYAPLPPTLPPLDLASLRVLATTTRPSALPFVVSALTPALADAHTRAAAALAAGGAAVELRDFPRFAHALDMWAAKMSAARTVAFRDHIGLPKNDFVLGHILECLLGASRHTLPALVLALTEDIGSLAPQRMADAAALADTLADELNAELAAGGPTVLLYPSFPTVAPRHRRTLLAPFDWAYTALFNALKLPVVQVPLGLDPASGLPVGVQVVGARGSDVLLIQVAAALEEACGGWVAPAPRAV